MADGALQKPNFSVCFEPANSLIRIIWQGEVSEQELKEGYELALETLRENPVKRLLIDQSRRKLQMQESPEQLFETLFNEALKLIGHTFFLALVVSKEEYFLTDEASRFCHYEIPVNNFVIRECFLTKEEAEAWLATVS